MQNTGKNKIRNTGETNKVSNTWREIIDREREKAYFRSLKETIDQEYETQTIFPPRELIFKAFGACSFTDLKVVILGQDPYHGQGQAMGLAFSTPNSIPNPPSLVNILKEIEASYGESQCAHGDLTPWANQGVLLLNTVLTVRSAQAHSHKNLGWEIFTDTIIATISALKSDVVFLLWGNHAKKKEVHIDTSKHHILSAPHPSPLSAHHGFLGCNHFVKTNEFLEYHNKKPIAW